MIFSPVNALPFRMVWRQTSRVERIRQVRRTNQGGVGLFILAVVVALAVFAGFRIAKLKFDAKTIESDVSEMGDAALVALSPDVKEQVVRALAFYDVTMNPDDVKVEITGDRAHIRIQFKYTRYADLLVTRIPLAFQVNVEREAKKAVGASQPTERRYDGATGQ